jgi:hypothetical protein
MYVALMSHQIFNCLCGRCGSESEGWGNMPVRDGSALKFVSNSELVGLCLCGALCGCTKRPSAAFYRFDLSLVGNALRQRRELLAPGRCLGCMSCYDLCQQSEQDADTLGRTAKAVLSHCLGSAIAGQPASSCHVGHMLPTHLHQWRMDARDSCTVTCLRIVVLRNGRSLRTVCSCFFGAMQRHRRSSILLLPPKLLPKGSCKAGKESNRCFSAH